MTDPIADLLIRIKNGYMARKQSVIVPHSNVKEALLHVLVTCAYIERFVRNEKDKSFTVYLSYAEGVPALTDVKRISKPGLRRYMGVKELQNMRRALGHVIVSTPQGVKTHIEAKKLGVGGEVLCAVW